MDTNRAVPFRPKLDLIANRIYAPMRYGDFENVPESVMNDVKALITWRWQEDEHERPSAGDVLTRINEISPSK